jgi:hypothetical protein
VAARPVLRQHPEVAVGLSLHGVAYFVAAVSAVGLPALLSVQLSPSSGVKTADLAPVSGPVP